MMEIPDTRLFIDSLNDSSFEDIDSIFESLLAQKISEYSSYICDAKISTSEDTQKLADQLLRIASARVELAVVTKHKFIDSFCARFLEAYKELVKVIRKRVFPVQNDHDYFVDVREVDYMYLDASKMLQMASLLPPIDLDLSCVLGDVLCDIITNLLGYIDRRMEELEKMKDNPLQSALLKKEILDRLRVRAFRHKNCCASFLDSICLQAAYKIADSTDVSVVYGKILETLKEKTFEIVHVKNTDTFCAVTENILQNDILAERFCVSGVNTCTSICADIMLIFNSCSGFENFIKKENSDVKILCQDHILSRLAARTESETLTLVTKSVIELRQVQADLKKLPSVSVSTGFRGISLIDRSFTFADYREYIYQRTSKICNKLVNLNLMIGTEDVLALDNNQLRSELDRSMFIAANFIFEFLLEVPLDYPYVQETFEKFVSPSFFWLLTYLEGFINGEHYWSTFYLIQSLEMLNPVISAAEYKHPDYFKAGIQPFKKAIQRFAKCTPTKDCINKHSYIVDLGRSYVARMEGVERKVRKGIPCIRFPDQDLLESKNYLIFTSFGSNDKLLYKCLDQRSRKLVIIKRILKSRVQNQSIPMGEVGTLMTMQHLNIVRYNDCFQSEAHWFLAMEYCEDMLSPFSDANGRLRLSELEIRRIGRQILHGLIYLHRNHIVHRDIKPANILKDGRGIIKLADFGDAQITSTDGESSDKFDLNDLVGTAAYTAPECLRRLKVDFSADIWSFGCVLIYLVSGEHPWSQFDNEYTILYNIATNTDYPADINALDCSEDCKRIIKTTLQGDPSKRPMANELINDPFFFNVPESIV